MQERDDEAAAGRVDVHGHVQSAVGGQLVQGGADLADRFELTGERGAEDRDHADGVLVDVLQHLLGGDDVAALLHRQVPRLDVEVAAELLPHHLHVGAHHQVRPALPPRIFLPDAFAPPPAQRETGQHDRLAGPDRGHPGRAGRVVVAQVLGVEQVGDHAHAAGLDRGGGRVLVLVDHVLVERLGHQLLGLRVHPRGDERRQVQPRAAVEHQLVVDEPVGGIGIHRFVGHPQRRDRRHGQPTGVGRCDLWAVGTLAWSW